jgi:hypothetical protein
MALVHSSGLVITEYGEHYPEYDGDSKYVVWNLSEAEPKASFTASYLPTLIKYLDTNYTIANKYKTKRGIK